MRTFRYILSLICAAALLFSGSRSAYAAGELLDLSGAQEGYISVFYSGPSASARAEITAPDGQVTPYPIPANTEARLPLCGGSGDYRVTILEETPQNQFAAIAFKRFERTSSNELAPFLIPTLYVNYTDDSECVKTAKEIYEKTEGDPASFVREVYNYIITNVCYDEDRSFDLPSDYLPDPDNTFKSGRGICLDYAALMAAMLRSCGIPARLMIGNFGAYYHAWVSVAEKIPADSAVHSAVWKTYDPTLGASNSAADVQKCIDRKTDYIVKHVM